MVMRPSGWSWPAPVDPTRRLYERFCARLAKAAGVQRADAEGPLDFSRRAAAAAPAAAADIDRITQLYIASRYAFSAQPDKTTADLRAAVHNFRPARVNV